MVNCEWSIVGDCKTLINFSTCQLFNFSTFQLFNFSTYQPINLSLKTRYQLQVYQTGRKPVGHGKNCVGKILDE
jgi:hypothetical protein